MIKIQYGFLLLFVISSMLMAQDDFQKWLKKDQQAYKKYLSEEDKQFADFLKKDWQAFRTSKGLKEDQKPKPVRLPVAKPSSKPVLPENQPVRKITHIPVPKPQPLPGPGPEPLPEVHPFQFKYYNISISVDFQKRFDYNLEQGISNEKIGAAWEVLGKQNLSPVLKQLRAAQKKMLINDWGYLHLVHSFAQRVFPNRENDALVLCWFLLVKSRFNAKIAYKSDQIFLLIASKDIIYANQFVTLKGTKYYFISFDKRPLDLSGKVYTYKGNYKSASVPIDLKVRYMPILSDKFRDRTLRFSFSGKKYALKVQYDLDAVDFFKSYPQTSLVLFFDAPVSKAARHSLAVGLKPYIEGKNEVEAVNFLLRFVQKSFQYKTDDQQFGKEKFLIPDETLYYPSSDCEDRSILFSFLVKNLLGLDVVALDYPGHVATAVRFSESIPGASVHFNGNRFVICDPTYINADAGMVMPEFKDVKPKVIQL